MTFTTNSPAQTEAVGAALGKILLPGTVIAYRGDLGAGLMRMPGLLPKSWI